MEADAKLEELFSPEVTEDYVYDLAMKAYGDESEATKYVVALAKSKANKPEPRNVKRSSDKS